MAIGGFSKSALGLDPNFVLEIIILSLVAIKLFWMDEGDLFKSEL